jgi:hypothetical protein
LHKSIFAFTFRILTLKPNPMKTKFLLVGLLMTHLTLNAQYGHRTYYVDSLNQEWFNDGLVTRSLLVNSQPLYVAAGRAQGLAAGSIERSRFVRSRFDGTTQFNRRYFIFRNGLELSNRINSIAEGNSVFVMSGAVSGVNIPGGTDVMLMRTTGNGTPSNIWKVDMGGNEQALCTRRSTSNTGNFFTAGSMVQGQAPNITGFAFLMRHTASALTISWVRRFTFTCPGSTAPVLPEITSVVQDSSSGRVVVVGNYKPVSPTTGCTGAFIARFTNGGNLDWLYLVNSGGASNIEFQSIRATTNNQEYVIAGSANSTAANGARPLLLKVNTSGAGPLFNFVFLYLSPNPTPNFPILNQRAFDVTVRRNGANEEYFMAGEVGYTFGSSDGFLQRTNSSGAPANSKFYFSNGNQALYAADVVSTSAANGNGIAAFGRWDNTGSAGAISSRSWLAKSYFNLVSGCNEINTVASLLPIQLSLTGISTNVFNGFSQDSLQVQSSNHLTNVICWSTTVAGGSNAREQDANASLTVDESELQVSAYPNPALSGTAFKLQIRSNTTTLADLRVTDISGRVTDHYDIELGEGSNEVSIPSEEWPAGIYLVQIQTREGLISTIRLMVR